MICIPRAYAAQVFDAFASLVVADGMEIQNELPSDPRVPYFRIECPSAFDGSVERVMAITPAGGDVQSMSRQQWNFLQRIPRLAICNILQTPEKVAWKRCVLDPAEEARIAKECRKVLKI